MRKLHLELAFGILLGIFDVSFKFIIASLDYSIEGIYAISSFNATCSCLFVCLSHYYVF